MIFGCDKRIRTDMPVLVCDIDGTIADISHRLHYITNTEKKDWDSFYNACLDDKTIRPVANLVQSLITFDRYEIVFCTGRPERIRNKTNIWLKCVFGKEFPLLMRPDGDYCTDDILKKRMYEELRYIGCNVQIVIEDRDRVVAMWRNLGITCLQCNNGSY